MSGKGQGVFFGDILLMFEHDVGQLPFCTPAFNLLQQELRPVPNHGFCMSPAILSSV